MMNNRVGTKTPFCIIIKYIYLFIKQTIKIKYMCIKKKTKKQNHLTIKALTNFSLIGLSMSCSLHLITITEIVTETWYNMLIFLKNKI